MSSKHKRKSLSLPAEETESKKAKQAGGLLELLGAKPNSSLPPSTKEKGSAGPAAKASTAPAAKLWAKGKGSAAPAAKASAAPAAKLPAKGKGSAAPAPKAPAAHAAKGKASAAPPNQQTQVTESPPACIAPKDVAKEMPHKADGATTEETARNKKLDELRIKAAEEKRRRKLQRMRRKPRVSRISRRSCKIKRLRRTKKRRGRRRRKRSGRRRRRRRAVPG